MTRYVGTAAMGSTMNRTDVTLLLARRSPDEGYQPVLDRGCVLHVARKLV
jgi:hypothetical protein